MKKKPKTTYNDKTLTKKTGDIGLEKSEKKQLSFEMQKLYLES